MYSFDVNVVGESDASQIEVSAYIQSQFEYQVDVEQQLWILPSIWDI